MAVKTYKDRGTKRFVVEISPNVYRQVRLAALRSNETMGKWVRRNLEKALEGEANVRKANAILERD
jgi:predicted HicB family RNase H-like nuclease